MTILITGGLLLLAVLAIAGAVLLGLSEPRSQTSRANARATSSPTIPTPAPSQAPTASRAAEQTAPAGQGLPATVERPQRSSGDTQQLYALNGQFHELAAELRTLYQQAWDLERRLRGLMERADRIEDKQDVEISIEEERYSQTPGSTPV